MRRIAPAAGRSWSDKMDDQSTPADQITFHIHIGDAGEYRGVRCMEVGGRMYTPTQLARLVEERDQALAERAIESAWAATLQAKLAAARVDQALAVEECDQARADAQKLHVLYEDVARWCESGDARDLRYVIDTMGELEADPTGAIKKQDDAVLRADIAMLREALEDLLRVTGKVAYTKFEDTGMLSSVETMARLALKEAHPGAPLLADLTELRDALIAWYRTTADFTNTSFIPATATLEAIAARLAGEDERERIAIEQQRDRDER